MATYQTRKHIHIKLPDARFAPHTSSTPPCHIRSRLPSPPLCSPCVQARIPTPHANLPGLESSRSRTDRTTRTTRQSATMPSEVSDIKQFIEICRRKDAQCTSCNFMVEETSQKEKGARRWCAGAIGEGRNMANGCDERKRCCSNRAVLTMQQPPA